MSGEASAACLPSELLQFLDVHWINFVPAGTLLIAGRISSTVVHQDGRLWSHFRPGLFMLDHEYPTELCRKLEYLNLHKFLTCTYTVNETQDAALLRLYIIPYDLRDVQGALRRRENHVLNTARKHLREILKDVSANPGRWNADFRAPFEPSFLPLDIDTRTMAGIFSDIESPKLSNSSPLSRHVITGGGIDLLRCTMYQYQRESVARMIEQETPKNVGDPFYIPLKGMDTTQIFFQCSTMEFLMERPTFSTGSGGVLCEELGVGKTVMALALILATRNELSAPPELILDQSHVFTPLSLRHFPSQDIRLARRRAYRALPTPPTIPTLVELTIHRIREKPELVHLERHEDILDSTPHLSRAIANNAPFYHHYHEMPTSESRSRRNLVEGPRTMYLTSATLVVVPGNLIAQWNSEIMKHCRSGIRLLLARSDDKLPSARILATSYDIVLITQAKLSREKPVTESTLAQLHSRAPCRCPESESSRVPICECGTLPGLSPLLSVRWKRLLIDEGHIASSKTHLTAMCDLLSVERRWLVTGTPTTNLLGLSFGRQSEDLPADMPVLDEDEYYNNTLSFENSLPETESEEGNSSSPTQPRVWTGRDREDLSKLATMLGKFLQIPALQNSADFSNLAIAPLLHKDGPLPGAIKVLTQIMEIYMIRHRIDDVEREVILPPLVQEIVLLDLHPIALKSYNALQAGLVINAIDSERQDKDYMFHPENVAMLRTVVENMTQILFWNVDEDLYNTVPMSRIAESRIQTAIDRGVSKEDLQLLKTAFVHFKDASSDRLWCALNMTFEMPFEVAALPGSIFDAYSRSDDKAAYSASPNVCKLLHLDRIILLRNNIVGKMVTSEERLIELGLEAESRESRVREMIKSSKKKSTAKTNEIDKGSMVKDMHAIKGNNIKSVAAKRTRSAAQTAAEVSAVGALADAQRLALEYVDDNDSVTAAMTEMNTKITNEANISSERLLQIKSSPLAQSRILSSTSSKLNYILKEVLQYSKYEKFLIFSQSTLTLAHIAEGLNLIGVKSLTYSTIVNIHQREQYVTTFETSETYRVFLMELKHGARGLNLISASRVIFCEPVWKADVESQAIKRVHRIGQNRSITVKTLAIRSTSEEYMGRRREEIKNQGGKMSNFTEDVGMRHFIANPKFLDVSQTDDGFDISLCLLDNDSSVDEDMDIDEEDEELLPLSPRKPRKRARVGGLE